MLRRFIPVVPTASSATTISLLSLAATSASWYRSCSTNSTTPGSDKDKPSEKTTSSSLFSSASAPSSPTFSSSSSSSPKPPTPPLPPTAPSSSSSSSSPSSVSSSSSSSSGSPTSPASTSPSSSSTPPPKTTSSSSSSSPSSSSSTNTSSSNTNTSSSSTRSKKKVVNRQIRSSGVGKFSSSKSFSSSSSPPKSATNTSSSSSSTANNDNNIKTNSNTNKSSSSSPSSSRSAQTQSTTSASRMTQATSIPPGLASGNADMTEDKPFITKIPNSASGGSIYSSSSSSSPNPIGTSHTILSSRDKKAVKKEILSLLRSGAIGGVSNLVKRGRLRSRSPSLTPASARHAAAHLRAIREAASKKLAAEKEKERKKNRVPPPNYETGEYVKGLWGIYLRYLHHSPVMAVFVTTCFLWAVGDSIAQAMEMHLGTKDVDEAVTWLEAEADQGESASSTFKWSRFLGAVVDGSLIAGVGGHFWYQALDKFVTGTCLLRRGTFSFVATKMLFEFVVWHPINLVTFWCVVGWAEGDSMRKIFRELRDDFFPTLAGEYALWGPFDIINFAIVPVHLQVILCNVISLIESVFLSYVRSQGFPGFPEPNPDSLEDRGMPISIIDVMRKTDIPFERALRDGARRFNEIDKEDKGHITYKDIKLYMHKHGLSSKPGSEHEHIQDGAECLLPGIPCARATQAASEILLRHAKKRGQISRREYLRFVGELNHAAYRTSLLPEVCFTLFDTTERHMITGSSLIQLATLLHEDSPEGKETVKLMMPVLEALREKELTVDEATAVLHGIDTLSKFHRGEISTLHATTSSSSSSSGSLTSSSSSSSSSAQIDLTNQVKKLAESKSSTSEGAVVVVAEEKKSSSWW